MRPMIEDRNIEKKHSLAAVVLLLIFAGGMLIGLLIVQARQRIYLSEPVGLVNSGLAVRVPEGMGWESTEVWVYEPPNRFAIVATLRTGVQRVASVRYQYVLAAHGVEPDEYLRAAAANMRIARRGRLGNGVEMEWAQLVALGEVADTVVGFAALPQGRALVLTVRTPGDHLLASRLFGMLVEAIEFETPEAIEAGAGLVARMREEGVARMLQESGGFAEEAAFLIKNFDRPTGFQIGQWRHNPDSRDWGVIKADRVYYEAGTEGGLSRSYFECSEGMDRYIWHTRRGRLAGGGGASIVELSAEGTLRASGGALLQDTVYRPVIAVPEVLMEQAARAFLGGPAKDAIIDIIFDDGRLIPMRVSAADGLQDPDNTWDVQYCVRFEYPGSVNSQTRFYFDGERRLAGRIHGGRRNYVWEFSDRRRLTEVFGDLSRFTGVESPTD